MVILTKCKLIRKEKNYETVPLSGKVLFLFLLTYTVERGLSYILQFIINFHHLQPLSWRDPSCLYRPGSAEQPAGMPANTTQILAQQGRELKLVYVVAWLCILCIACILCYCTLHCNELRWSTLCLLSKWIKVGKVKIYSWAPFQLCIWSIKDIR